jgi:hypothetical protein
MKMIVEGIMTGQLPWILVFIGVALVGFCFLANIPILTVALGMDLPIGIFAVIRKDITFGLQIAPALAASSVFAFFMFLTLAIWIYMYSIKKVDQI